MRASLLTALALAVVLALTGCGEAAPGTAAASATGAASPPEGVGAPSSALAAPAATASADAASPASASTEGKVHFTGDYTKTTSADSQKIIELARQWYSPAKEAALREKMASTGLAARAAKSVPDRWYAESVTSCQARFDGYIVPVSGISAEIDSLVRSEYCPEVG